MPTLLALCTNHFMLVRVYVSVLFYVKYIIEREVYIYHPYYFHLASCCLVSILYIIIISPHYEKHSISMLRNLTVI